MIIIRRLSIIFVASFLIFASCKKQQKLDFIHVENGHFVKDGQPYYYVGTNFWYGAILASTGQGGNRDRLNKELNFLKSIGVDNLRILVGADGENGVKTRVEPTLQTSPGVYNDTILDGLDYLMQELGKRQMYAVLYLNNSWEWSGGYSVYLQWSGAGKAPVPAINGWNNYLDYVRQFVKSDSAKHLFANHVRFIINRTNRYTHKKYADDPTIMSWEIGNEPRAFSDENKQPFARWLAKTSRLIKSFDKNHMVTIGSEGSKGCENDIKLFEQIHADSNIDYLTCHIWPYNWKWASEDSLIEKLPTSKINTKKYIDAHLAIAQKLNKPLVIEEFGYPRDGFQFAKNTSTTARDNYYNFIFNLIEQSAVEKSFLAGCNFWAWGGFANPQHTYWQLGDDYTGDPAQEQQGLNSVFASDSSTVQIIKATNASLEYLNNK